MEAGTGRLQAQNYAGYDVSLHGATFTYDHTDWNYPPVDYYLANGIGNYAVFNGTGYSGVATVSHSADENASDFNGFWINGGYIDAHQEVSIGESITLNGSYYTASNRTLDYSLDGSGQLVYATYTVYSGSSGSVTVQIDASGNGSISGSQTGFVLGGSWYVNTVDQTSDDPRSYNGSSYLRTSVATNYALVSGNVETSYVYTYSPTSGPATTGFTVSLNPDGSGVISGSVNGYVLNGNWYVSTDEPITSPSLSPPSPLLGRYYGFVSGTRSVVYQSNGNSTYVDTMTFTASPATLTVVYNGATGTLSGNDPDYGGFTGTYENGTWTGTITRTAPTFTGATIYLHPDTPIRFRTGSGNFNGDVTDTYTTDDNTLTVIMSGNPSNSTINVDVSGPYGNNTGSFNGSFSVGGYQLRTSPFVTYYTPHTSPSQGGLVYWVNGRQLNWSDGGDSYDSDGYYSSSSDNWSNSSTGDYMNISTSSYSSGTGNSYSINVMVGGISYWGYSNTGSFMWNNNIAPDISDTNPAITGGPHGFAIGYRGAYPTYYEYFEQVAPNSPYYGGSSGRNLKLTPNGNETFNVHYKNEYNMYGYDDYDFTYNGQPGVFNIDIPTNPNAAGSTVVAFTTTSYEIDVPGNTPPSGYPPAIYVPGLGTYAYVGTAADIDDTSVTDAYYVAPGLNWWGGGVEAKVLKIRLSDNSVFTTYNYYNTAEGYYDPATHLFSLDPNKPGLPMPTYGVDPLNNNMPWQLPTPPDGFPATAVVNGELFRFVSVDGDGVLHYVAAYPSQTLTLTPNTSRAGVYDVVLTTPYGSGNDTGEFHNFTFTMDNQNQVISGTQTGSTINPINIPRHNFAGDIDIFGNVLSLGSLQNDPDLVGLTMSFADNLTTSSLTMALARPSSAWTWGHAATLGSGTMVPSMKLDASHRLGIYSLTDASVPAIVLDPVGTSNFKADVSVQGTLRVKQRGDLGMGAFTNGPQP